MADTYPTGYGKQVLTMPKLRARYEPKMHPEYAARLFQCLEAAGGLVGVGNGFRSSAQQAANYKKSPGRFAPPGKSFHESHKWTSGIEAFAAVDTVGRGGQHQEAWSWMRDNAGQFGLRTFADVNGEPWHVQFSDLPNGVSSWKRSGSPDPGTLATTSSSWKPAEPDFGLYPLNDGKPVLKVGWLGDLVRYLQLVISHRGLGKITVDGDFGPQTESKVRDTQADNGLRATGIVDWEGTWQVIDELAGRTKDAKVQPKPPPVPKKTAKSATKKPAPAKKEIGNVKDGYYWVRRGDSPWGVAARVFGNGSQHAKLEPTKPKSPGFGAPDHHIRLPGVAGRTTKVRPGEGAWAIIGRLYPDAKPAQLLTRFYDLNGGVDRILQPNDLVFLDTPG